MLIAAGLDQRACGTTLAALLAGDSLDAGNMRFGDWELVALDATSPPDMAQILVEPLLDDPANLGLQLAAGDQLSTTGLDSIDFTLRFHVGLLAGTGFVAGQTLKLTSATFGTGGGIVYVSTEVTKLGGSDLSAAVVIADKHTDVFQTLDTSSFAPQPEILVTMNIFVTGLAGGDTPSLNSFTHRFSQVPEPSSMLLALVAIVGCPWIARRARRNHTRHSA